MTRLNQNRAGRNQNEIALWPRDLTGIDRQLALESREKHRAGELAMRHLEQELR
jgi:hypothetical protein